MTDDSGQTAALAGYLNTLVEHGAENAFDQLLNSDTSGMLGDLARLRVSVSGPQSDAGWARVSTLITQLSPEVGARGLFWWHNLDPSRLQGFLADWLPRIHTQADYNSVVDFVSLCVHRKSEWIDSVDPLLAHLVALRSRFGRLAHGEEWNWEQLARRQLATRPTELLATLLDLVHEGELEPHMGADENEAGLLQDVVVAAGADGWRRMMARLETGSWQFHAVAERWLGGATDVDTVRNWVEGRVERARLVASVCDPGGEQLRPVARFLIRVFGSDEQVSGNLRSGLMPQSWWGSDTAMYEQLINRVKAWSATDDQLTEVDAWIRTTLEQLETLRVAASKQEAESDQ